MLVTIQSVSNYNINALLLRSDFPDSQRLKTILTAEEFATLVNAGHEVRYSLKHDKNTIVPPQTYLRIFLTAQKFCS